MAGKEFSSDMAPGQLVSSLATAQAFRLAVDRLFHLHTHSIQLAEQATLRSDQRLLEERTVFDAERDKLEHMIRVLKAQLERAQRRISMLEAENESFLRKRGSSGSDGQWRSEQSRATPAVNKDRMEAQKENISHDSFDAHAVPLAVRLESAKPAGQQEASVSTSTPLVSHTPSLVKGRDNSIFSKPLAFTSSAKVSRGDNLPSACKELEAQSSALKSRRGSFQLKPNGVKVRYDSTPKSAGVAPAASSLGKASTSLGLSRTRGAVAIDIADDDDDGGTYADYQEDKKRKQGKQYKYHEKVLGKDARAALKATTCVDCEAFYDHCGLDNRDRYKEISRHRHIHSPPSTPAGFYELGDFNLRPSQLESERSSSSARLSPS